MAGSEWVAAQRQTADELIEAGETDAAVPALLGFFAGTLAEQLAHERVVAPASKDAEEIAAGLGDLADAVRELASVLESDPRRNI